MAKLSMSHRSHPMCEVDGSIGARTRVCLQLSGALSKSFCTDPLPASTLEELAAGTGRVVPFDLGGLTEGNIPP